MDLKSMRDGIKKMNIFLSQNFFIYLMDVKIVRYFLGIAFGEITTILIFLAYFSAGVLRVSIAPPAVEIYIWAGLADFEALKEIIFELQSLGPEKPVIELRCVAYLPLHSLQILCIDSPLYTELLYYRLSSGGYEVEVLTAV